MLKYFRSLVEKMKDYKRDLCVCGSHVYRNINAMFGSIPPYVSAIWGCSDCMRLAFSSPLPGCPSLPPPAILDSPEQLFELVLQMKVSLLGPLSRIYAAGTAIEPFLLTLSCSRDRIV